jgi:hypothetical protein
MGLAHLEVGHLFDRRGLVIHAPIIGVDVEHPLRRIERHRPPVLAAGDGGIDALFRTFLHDVLGHLAPDRSTGFLVDSVRPVDLHERVGRDELAGRALDHVQEPVAVRMHDNLARGSVGGDLGQDPLVDAVVVERIAGRHLEAPNHLAGLGLHGEDRIGVEVVAFAIERIPRRRIAGTPEHEIEFRIVGTGDPGGAAALPPGVSRPGLGAGLSFSGMV